jgi:hypothetical protein
LPSNDEEAAMDGNGVEGFETVVIGGGPPGTT